MSCAHHVRKGVVLMARGMLVALAAHKIPKARAARAAPAALAASMAPVPVVPVDQTRRMRPDARALPKVSNQSMETLAARSSLAAVFPMFRILEPIETRLAEGIVSGAVLN